jgi:acrylyl-CoA reductase (NADPH)
MTTQRAMAIGTAGFTAMLAVMALEAHGLAPEQGEVLVTGASGGVGSVAIALLAGLGHQVVASTGRPENHDYLRSLGAAATIDRSSLAVPLSRPLATERWAGAVDNVASATLATILTQLKYRASVAACGLVGSSELPASVIPFLLRGVKLLGIDSVLSPMPERLLAWRRLATELPVEKLDSMTRIVPLADLPEMGRTILAGATRGRIVVDVNA